MSFGTTFLGSLAPAGTPGASGGQFDVSGKRIVLPNTETLTAAKMILNRGLVRETEIAPETRSFLGYLGFPVIHENGHVGFAPGVSYVGDLVRA